MPLFTIRIEAEPELTVAAIEKFHRQLSARVGAIVTALSADLPPGTKWSCLVERGIAEDQP